jgi:hypothetical protein
MGAADKATGDRNNLFYNPLSAQHHAKVVKNKLRKVSNKNK